jgi:CRP-like cAMP-binding protein
MMPSLQEAIAEHPFFAGLPLAQIDLIAGCATQKQFPADTFIFREEEEADQFYLIQKGHVVLKTFLPERGIETIQTIHENEVLGWSWLFEPYRWHYHACTLDPTEAIAFDGVRLRTQCEADHDLGYELMKRFANIVIQRLQATRLHLLDVYAVHPR